MITAAELEILRKPEVQKCMREKMGQWEIGDLYLFDEGFYVVDSEKQFVLNYYYRNDKKYIRIPDCISRDSDRPERGLVGMLLAFHYPNLHYNAYANEWVVDLIEKDTLTRVGFHHADTPRLALLKALEWQIGRKP